VWTEPLCRRLLAQTERSRGNYQVTMEVVMQTCELARRYGEQSEMSWCQLCMAELEMEMGEPEASRARLEAPQPPGTPE
jgi:hypothetical protein